MVIKKTYGSIHYSKDLDEWVIKHAEPHVCIKMKNIFQFLSKTETAPFKFKNTPENCFDLIWFMERYPLALSKNDKVLMGLGKAAHIDDTNEREAILLPKHIPVSAALREGEEARDYQLRARDLFIKTKRLLLADDMGLGKTLSAIISTLTPGALPAVVVLQTHLPIQWRKEIERFTQLKVHVVKTRKPYNLPAADIYLMKYTSLMGWVDVFKKQFFKMAIFDEIQELRHSGTEKYTAAWVLSENATWVMGMSGTPIYNYGDEIFTIANLIYPGCLGSLGEFMREWCPGGKRVSDPKALGTYLRDKFIMLRRTREDVGRQLPDVNKLVYTVEYDEVEVQKVEELARKLAMATTVGSFMERGQASRELDMRIRHTTGVSKARDVANWVRMFMENEEPVVLAGWHRDVYDIWMEELAAFKPVLYTGSESPTQKEESKRKFLDGETNLFIISLRSGVGLDGLQKRCKTVIFGELDWSPKVHDQVVTRVDRDGQPDAVTAIYLISEWGSDPVIVDLLGVKSSQSRGIIDPLLATTEQYSDESRIQLLAKQFLNKKGMSTLSEHS